MFWGIFRFILQGEGIDRCSKCGILLQIFHQIIGIDIIVILTQGAARITVEAFFRLHPGWRTPWGGEQLDPARINVIGLIKHRADIGFIPPE
ncbi:hypothetical protein D3C74_380890 [compost metagenome]